MPRILLVVLIAGLFSTSALAQFVGGSLQGRVSTVEEARNARMGSYVTVTGNITAHLRQDFYTFRDGSGEIRIEVPPGVWQDREVRPDTKVRLLAEVDRRWNMQVYLWVKSLELLE